MYRGSKTSARKITALMIVSLLLFLPACNGSHGKNEAESIREYYGTLETFNAKAEVKVDFGDRVDVYILDYAYDNGSSRITVVLPESIAGITAVTSDDGVTLEFEDVILDAGKPEGLEMSPAGALAYIHKVWRENTAENETEETINDTKAIRLHYSAHIDKEKVDVASWFVKDSYLPLRAEISYNGRMIIACDYLSGK